jgi:predicted dehydrogenase
MAEKSSIRVAVVGLGFGAEFVPIYLHHPNVASVVICDQDATRLNETGDRFRISHRLRSFEEVLASPDLDAVHLVTGIPLHAEQSVAVLESGKHCACTVPMATSIEGLRAVVAAQRKSGRNYMMMETAVYTRHYLYVKVMLERGDMGAMQFLRGAHYQDMEDWPPYWAGLPPMHYATHAVAPLLALAGRRAASVCCFGSGRMRPALMQQYGNPFPIETAILRLEGTDVAAEVTRSLFHTAKAYLESFDVLCERVSFEWAITDDSLPVLHRMVRARPDQGGAVTVEQVEPPDRADLLPPSIARFTRRTVYDESDPHLSFLQGGGHHGSHPHLVHEFVMSIVEQRQPRIDAITAANWTAPGICAHESAMSGGSQVQVPCFAEEERASGQ